MKTVTILMSTYNGEKYLREQIDSLLNQKDVNVNILVRDDSSSDSTINILQEYENTNMLKWYSGNNLKPAKSFMDLIRKAPDSEYYAFCDQDDYWLEDKLSIATSILEDMDHSKPCLYYGRPRLVDGTLNPIKIPDRAKDHMDSFYESLINITCTGCTVVFNKHLLDKVREKEPEFVWMHDAWIHQVCIVTGGVLFFDEDVHILYRQHGNNVIGISNSKSKLLLSHFSSLKKKECARSKIMASILENYSEYISEDKLQIVYLIVNYKNSLSNKLKIIFSTKIKSKYFKRNVLFKLAILLNAY